MNSSSLHPGQGLKGNWSVKDYETSTKKNCELIFYGDRKGDILNTHTGWRYFRSFIIMVFMHRSLSYITVIWYFVFPCAGTLKLDISPCPAEPKYCLTPELYRIDPYPDDKGRPTKEIVEFPQRDIYKPYATYRYQPYIYKPYTTEPEPIPPAGIVPVSRRHICKLYTTTSPQFHKQGYQ